MRRHAFLALCAACALAIGIPASIGIGADGAEQASRPLSQVPPVERFGQAALDAQSEFIRAMPSAEVRVGDNGAVTRIAGNMGIVLKTGLAGFKVGEPAKELLEKFGPALLAAGTEELRVVRIHSEAAKADPVERQHSPERTIRLRQYIGGREVLLSAVNISLNQQTNEVTLLVANFLPDRGLQHDPKLTSAETRSKVEAAMRVSELEAEQKFVFSNTPPRLAYAFEEIGNDGGVGGVLVWVFQVSNAATGEPLEASISALTGEIIRLQSTTTGALSRASYTADYTNPNPDNFPLGLILTPTPQDSLAFAAYDNAEITYNAFKLGLNPSRLSWNGADGTIRLVTHFLMGAGNAFYAPGGYLVFSDGATGIKSLAEDLDAVAHEFAHGVVATELETPTGFVKALDTVDGAAALNEAFADWGSTVVDVHQNAGTSLSTWAMASRNPGNQFDALRNWQTPILVSEFGVLYRDWFPQRTFIPPSQPPGGDYLNSTIMGHAFYLLTTGGQHYRAGLPGSGVPQIPVTGIGYQAARDIFYAALRAPALTSTSNFFNLRDITVGVALPAHQSSVHQAWAAVGLDYDCSSAPQTPQIQVWPGYCLGRNKITWNAVPGAAKYHGQATRVQLGWALASTIVDSDVTECKQNIPPGGDWWVRVRACNGCGCSGWSPQGLMQYWNTCQ